MTISFHILGFVAFWKSCAGYQAVQRRVMIPMKKTVLGAGRSDSQVRPHKLPWKQGCQVEWEITLAIHTHTHSTAKMWFSFWPFMIWWNLICSHSAAVIIHCKLFNDCSFSCIFFPPILFSFHIPDPNLGLSVSWGGSGSRQWVTGMEDAVRHVGSPVWEECSMSGMSRVEGVSQGRENPQRLNPTTGQSLLCVLLM